jgi:signal transduction histidine kinase
MARNRKTDRFDLLTRRIAWLAVACILLPTLVLSALVMQTYMRGRKFSKELSDEFVPYGMGLLRDRIAERYSSECIALLDRYRDRARTGNLYAMDLSFVFHEHRGIAQTVFQYSNIAGRPTTLPVNAFRGADAEKLRIKLSALLNPKMIDSHLHYLPITLDGDNIALPYVYVYDNKLGMQTILGFVPDPEYLERELFSSLLHTDIFASPDIFQGEVLDEYFAFVIRRNSTPVASTKPTFAVEALAVEPVGIFLPFYDISMHYQSVELRILEDISPPILWGLITLLVAVFLIGLYFFLMLAIREIRLSQATSHFISNVSHEFKTPLSLIRLYNETLELRRYRDDTERHKFHRTIERETVRLANMISKLLFFSRGIEGRKQYSFQQLDLKNLVAEIIDDYAPQLEDAGFSLERNFDGSIEPLPLDRESISQAVINLLDNAQKYSGNSKFVSVTVAEGPDGPYVKVTDKGMGISKEEQDKIFEMFYRVEHGLIHDVKGLGIGLAVVSKIMEDHGGSVKVESELGKGSEFTLLFKREGSR